MASIAEIQAEIAKTEALLANPALNDIQRMVLQARLDSLQKALHEAELQEMSYTTLYGFRVIGTSNGAMMYQELGAQSLVSAESAGVAWLIANDWAVDDAGTLRYRSAGASIRLEVMKYDLYDDGVTRNGSVVKSIIPAPHIEEGGGGGGSTEPVGRNQWLGLIVIGLIIVLILWGLPKLYKGAPDVVAEVKEAV